MTLGKEYDGIYQYPQIVQDWWKQEKNYLIEYDNAQRDNRLCAIYFSSNDIWFPHTEEIFRHRIVEKNFFEWYKCRINAAHKHIFLRDVFKQWYLTGINADIPTQEKLLEFLKEETNGYRVVTIGSSAGGYAAVYFGQRLNADYVIAFNAQFSLERLVRQSTKSTNPILFSMLKPIGGGGNILLNDNAVPVFYVYSNHSKWDNEQHQYIKECKSVQCIEFNSKKHGIPFLKVALPVFINFKKKDLERLTTTIHYSISFTVQLVGLFKAIKGFFDQVYQVYKKRH